METRWGNYLRAGILAFLVIVLALTLSSSALSESSAREPTEIRLGAADYGRQVKLAEGQVLVVSLEANLSTGYGWGLKKADLGILRQVGEIEFHPQSKLLGAPGKQVLRFEAAEAGKADLELVYRRPWEKDVEPADAFSVQVEGVGTFEGVSGLMPTPEAKRSVESSTPLLDSQPALGLPAAFDWCASGGCTAIRDQSTCGSCWAFATVGTLECNIKIHDAVSRDLSEQYLLSCNEDGYDCNGGLWAHDYHWWKKPSGELAVGAVDEADFPYTALDTTPCNPPHDHHEKIFYWNYVGSQYGVPSVAAIKQAIYYYGPVAVGVYIGSAFQAYTGGIFESTQSGASNHAVLLVGWDDAQGTNGVWILRNSWGTGWGESGYMRIGYGISNVGDAASYVVYTSSSSVKAVYLPLGLRKHDPSYPWNNIMTQDFEGAFPTGNWGAWDNNGPSYGEYYWDEDDFKPYGGSHSAWPANGGANGLDPQYNNYPNRLDSWMTYGPFSLSDATDAEMLFRYWNQSEAGYDYLAWAASVDGSSFNGSAVSGDSGGWRLENFDLTNVPSLGDLRGQPQVWIAFIFQSDSSITHRGAFVDDIVLRKMTMTAGPSAGLGKATPPPEPSGMLVKRDFKGELSESLK